MSLPWSKTRIRSASRSVLSRWAMAIVVRPLRQHAERSWIAFSRLGVDAAGRLVEDQDLRVVEQGAGDREPLPLAAGEAGAALAEPGVVAQRRVEDEVVGLGRPAAARSLARAPASGRP